MRKYKREGLKIQRIGQSAAKLRIGERSTTKGRGKRPEAVGIRKDDDIVSSHGKL